MLTPFKKPAVLFFMLAVLLVCAACGANKTGTATSDTSTSSPSAAVVESASPQASEAPASAEKVDLNDLCCCQLDRCPSRTKASL